MSTINIRRTRGFSSPDAGSTARGRRRAETGRRPADEPGRMGRVGSVASMIGRSLLTLTLVVSAVLFLFLAIGPRVFGYQTSTMLTASMSPEINPGDVVVSVQKPTADLQVNDVITFSIPIDDHRIETHRIVSVDRDEAGTTSVTTKGDANAGPDPWKAVLTEDYVYTKAAVVPYLGSAIRALREPPVQSTLLYGAPALLVLMLLKSIWSKPAPATESARSDRQGRA